MNEQKTEFYKRNEGDTIWWVYTPGVKGLFLFSFDKENIFNLFRDYPEKLSIEQKRVFDKENPYWKKIFKT